MSYRVVIRSSAERELGRIDPHDRRRIGAKIDSLADNPRPAGCEKLSGTDAWRIRVGVYRVVYTVADEVLIVEVIHVGHRREVYRNL
ncbi:MAG: type II toxin-antitoxin system RelE/ParE family toxin [Tepidisphaeraceae bacterium]|jgi:mRNA interferase RelE/StbE